MKRHLKRIIGTASLTVTEIITVLTQVEAILNSQSITPMSDDPKDLGSLTPEHFLIVRWRLYRNPIFKERPRTGYHVGNTLNRYGNRYGLDGRKNI